MYPPVTFNNNAITKCPHQKHMGDILDSKLDFNIHIEQKIKKCNKIIGLIRRLSISLPRKALLTIYKSLRLILTTVIFCMINQTMKILKINLKRFSTKVVLQSPLQGNSNLILILRNNQMRFSFLINQIHICIHQSHSVTMLSLNVLIRST